MKLKITLWSESDPERSRTTTYDTPTRDSPEGHTLLPVVLSFSNVPKGPGEIVITNLSSELFFLIIGVVELHWKHEGESSNEEGGKEDKVETEGEISEAEEQHVQEDKVGSEATRGNDYDEKGGAADTAEKGDDEQKGK
ncbi:hypothetical protein Moror_2553 [Moniliophthora roreri MCA 2997]|uniref:Uncharacterized protein n=1 Tax=Moniliophthora roreri (strain MCA 2997) TaxID=1381753 RepID=V2WXF4_MONRO|nr:hypothetical protein Moror_2553 [Moniliophthora roreri MCA 2997]